VRPLVLSRGYLSSSEPMLHFGLGDDTVIRKMTVTWPSGRVQVFENLGVDRRFTVTEPSAPTAPVPAAAAVPLFEETARASGLELRSREDAVDESALQPLMPLRLNRRGPALALGDLGGGRDSVIVGGTTLDPLRVLAGSASGLSSSAQGIPNQAAAVDDGPILLLDAAGGGREDLLVTRGGNALPAGAPEYQPVLLLNDGHGGFGPAPAGVLPALSTASTRRRPGARSSPTAVAGSRMSLMHSPRGFARSAW